MRRQTLQQSSDRLPHASPNLARHASADCFTPSMKNWTVVVALTFVLSTGMQCRGDDFPKPGWFVVKQPGKEFVSVIGGATSTLVHIAPRPKEILSSEGPFEGVPGLDEPKKSAKSQDARPESQSWNLTFHRIAVQSGEVANVNLDRITLAARFEEDLVHLFPDIGEPIKGGVRKESNDILLILGEEHREQLGGLLSPGGSIHLVPAQPEHVEFIKHRVASFFRETLSVKNVTGARSILQELIGATYSEETGSFADIAPIEKPRAFIKSAEYIGSCESPFGPIHIARLFFVRPASTDTGSHRGRVVLGFFDSSPSLKARWELDSRDGEFELVGTKLRFNGKDLLDFSALPDAANVIVDGKPMAVPRWIR